LMNARTVSFSIFQAAENIPTSRGRKLAIYTGFNGRLPGWFPGMSLSAPRAMKNLRPVY
jgi:hypothetical protein